MSIVSFIQDTLNQHPLLIAFDVLALVAAFGCLVVLVREAILFRGYRRLKRLAKAIASALRGTTFRDGADLVINGFYRGVPAVVRFSFAENTPEVNLWMKVSSTLNLFVVHRSSKSTEGRVRVPTRDAWFDERFMVRSDDPNDAVTFLSDEGSIAELKRLCCSPGTSVALTRESLELSELTIPHPHTLNHLIGHLDSLAAVAVHVGAIANLHKAPAKIYVPDRYIVARAALAALVIAGAIEVYSGVSHYQERGVAPATTDASPVAALPAEDEQMLPGLDQWRLASPDDFDADALAWTREHGKGLSGQIVGSFGGPGQRSGRAYVFVRKNEPQQNPWRVAILSQGQTVLDAAFQGVTEVVLVPQSKFANIHWASGESGAPMPPDGDGIMLVRRAGETESATIFYLSGGKLQTGVPADYLSVQLQ